METTKSLDSFCASNATSGKYWPMLPPHKASSKVAGIIMRCATVMLPDNTFRLLMVLSASGTKTAPSLGNVL